MPRNRVQIGNHGKVHFAEEAAAAQGSLFCFAQPHLSETADKAIGQHLSFTLFDSIEGYLGRYRTGYRVH